MPKTTKFVDARLERLSSAAHSIRQDRHISEEGLRRLLSVIENEKPKIDPQGEIVRFSARVKTKVSVNSWDSVPADDRLALPVWLLVSWLANPAAEQLGYCLEQLRLGVDQVFPGEFDRVVKSLLGD